MCQPHTGCTLHVPWMDSQSRQMGPTLHEELDPNPDRGVIPHEQLDPNPDRGVIPHE